MVEEPEDPTNREAIVVERSPGSVVTGNVTIGFDTAVRVIDSANTLVLKNIAQTVGTDGDTIRTFLKIWTNLANEQALPADVTAALSELGDHIAAGAHDAGRTRRLLLDLKNFAISMSGSGAVAGLQVLAHHIH